MAEFKIESIRQFYKIDANKDGKISKEESTDAVAAYDGNNNGSVELLEFLQKKGIQKRKELIAYLRTEIESACIEDPAGCRKLSLYIEKNASIPLKKIGINYFPFPENFIRETFEASLRRNKNILRGRIKWEQNRKRNFELNVKCRNVGVNCDVERSARDLAESLLVVWLVARHIGQDDINILKQAFKFKAHLNKYWRATMAGIFVKDEALAREFLPKLGLKTGVMIKFPRENRLAVLEEIYSTFLGEKANPHQRANNLTERALILWELGEKEDALALKTQAMQLIAYIKDPANEKKVKRAIASRDQYLPRVEVNKEYKEYQGRVRVYELKLAKLSDDPNLSAQDRLKRSELEYAIAGIASGYLHYQTEELFETYLLGAGCLVEKAKILKDMGKDPTGALRDARFLLDAIVEYGDKYAKNIRPGSIGNPLVKEISDKALEMLNGLDNN